MSAEVKKETMPQTTAIAGWEPPMPPTDLIFDDGERNGRATATVLL